ncbi:hypothetical protein [Pontibacter fetidus]|uniref:Uncharacterized protein n=1 Tax=Pontibacter fetidus TaxID=2700082 RepID=A0A6B2H3N7_9BACT|nr:hypothetical protein [Pontibacter fetidus]NDK57735.1 hypothetical protein [Pontibacter fetidus]
MKKLLLTFQIIALILVFSADVSALPKKKFTGVVSNGMKGDKISFILSADGKWVEEFTFNGYWRCDGTLEQVTIGPEKRIPVKNGKISGIVVDPENGGATAWRFDVQGSISGKKASGTFRMNINALRCDSYVLKWTATTK